MGDEGDEGDEGEGGDLGERLLPNTARLSLKNYFGVGWVEERNPTFSGLCWVSLCSTQPTNFLNRIVLDCYLVPQVFLVLFPCPMPHALCPMPNARCPMPHALFPRFWQLRRFGVKPFLINLFVSAVG
jgi:hypothetical protein